MNRAVKHQVMRIANSEKADGANSTKVTRYRRLSSPQWGSGAQSHFLRRCVWLLCKSKTQPETQKLVSGAMLNPASLSRAITTNVGRSKLASGGWK
jgi:hypothetical protein